MNQYYVLVRTEDRPGAMVTKVFIHADNPISAYQILKAQYGNLLLSESAAPVPYDWR